MKVFVCSPYRSETELGIMANVVLARRLCRAVALTGHFPFAPHVYFTQFLKDHLDSERALGIDLGLKIMQWCDELWHYVPEGSDASEGMLEEMKKASDLGLPCVNLSEHWKYLPDPFKGIVTEVMDGRR